MFFDFSAFWLASSIAVIDLSAVPSAGRRRHRSLKLRCVKGHKYQIRTALMLRQIHGVHGVTAYRGLLLFMLQIGCSPIETGADSY
jgi:hypothetical protein